MVSTKLFRTMAKYTQEIADKVDTLIPVEVREALTKFGWNELGIYEAVKEAIKEVKKEGGKVLRT